MAAANHAPTCAISADRAHPSDGGRVVLMARSGGYVMVRRPRCAPFVLREAEWAKLPKWQKS